MKYYTREEKIYVPHDPQTHGVFMDSNYYVSYHGLAGKTPHAIEVVPQSDVIVIDKKEFRALLDDIAYEVNHNGYGACSVTHHFVSNYLKGKGIKL